MPLKPHFFPSHPHGAPGLRSTTPRPTNCGLASTSGIPGDRASLGRKRLMARSALAGSMVFARAWTPSATRFDSRLGNREACGAPSTSDAPPSFHLRDSCTRQVWPLSRSAKEIGQGYIPTSKEKAPSYPWHMREGFAPTKQHGRSSAPRLPGIKERAVFGSSARRKRKRD